MLYIAARCTVCQSNPLYGLPSSVLLFLHSVFQVFVLTVWHFELFMLPLLLLLFIGRNYFHITPGVGSHSQDLVSAVTPYTHTQYCSKPPSACTNLQTEKRSAACSALTVVFDRHFTQTKGKSQYRANIRYKLI